MKHAWAHKQKTQKGFTLVELLIVIVVIAILAAISIVAYNGIQNRAYDTTVKADLSSMAKKFQIYKIDHGSYPKTSPDLVEVGATVTKSAYLVQPDTVYNVVPCVANGAKEFAIAAISKSGKRYYVSSQTGGVEQFNGASNWTDISAFKTMCEDTLTGSAIPTGGAAPGYGQAWRVWLDE